MRGLHQMTDRAEIVKTVELRLPSEVAFLVNLCPSEARQFLTDWAEHMKDPDAYQANQEAAKPKSMLQQAEDTINGPRQADYGDKLTNFSHISMMVQGLLAPKLLPDSRITPEDIAMIMMLVKMSRLAKSPDHYDSVLDIAGYAGCYDHIQKDRAAGKKLKGALRDARAN